MFCTNCGKDINSGLLYCSNCGNRMNLNNLEFNKVGISEKKHEFCIFCGKKNTERYCVDCGGKLYELILDNNALGTATYDNINNFKEDLKSKAKTIYNNSGQKNKNYKRQVDYKNQNEKWELKLSVKKILLIVLVVLIICIIDFIHRISTPQGLFIEALKFLMR